MVVLAGAIFTPTLTPSPGAAKQWVGSVVMATTGLPEEETEAPSGICVLLRLAHQTGGRSGETLSAGNTSGM